MFLSVEENVSDKGVGSILLLLLLVLLLCSNGRLDLVAFSLLLLISPDAFCSLVDDKSGDIPGALGSVEEECDDDDCWDPEENEPDREGEEFLEGVAS